MPTSASSAMIATNAIFMALACISVALRLHLRRMNIASGMNADDWLIVAALAFTIALAITNIVGVPVGGFGVPFPSLSDAKAQTFLKFVFVMQFWYILAVGMVKLSILCLYGRIFSARRFTMTINFFLSITLGWIISFLFATFFQVWPIRCNWVTCVPTTNYVVMYLCSSVTDIVLDVAILCIPYSVIRTLNMSQGQKVGLIGIFGLGVFCIIASVARLSYIIKYEQVNIELDYGVNFSGPVVNMIMWSGIEACASTICANLPCYGPLLRKVPSARYIVATIRAVFTSARSFFTRRSMTKSSYVETTSTENFASKPGISSDQIAHESGVHCQAHEPDIELGQMNV